LSIGSAFSIASVLGFARMPKYLRDRVWTTNRLEPEERVAMRELV
jgi:hypothetical protein